jgi:hypothetical protein
MNMPSRWNAAQLSADAEFGGSIRTHFATTPANIATNRKQIAIGIASPGSISASDRIARKPK